MDELAPYEALAAVADRALAELVADRFDAFERLQAEFEQRLAEIAHPAHPAPAAAGPILRRTFAVHEQTTAELLLRRQAIADELAQIRRGRAAAAGYGATAGQVAVPATANFAA